MNHQTKFHILLCAAILLFQNVCAINSKIDSLTLVYNNSTNRDTNYVRLVTLISKEYYKVGDNDNSIEYAEIALEIAKSIDDEVGVAVLNKILGFGYSNKDQYKKALDYYTSALKVWERRGNEDKKALIIHAMAQEYSSLGDYEKAEKYYKNAIEIDQKNNNKRHLARGLNDLGYMYKYQGKYEHALINFVEAFKIGEELNDINNLILYTGNIGSVYSKQGNYDKALEYYTKVLEKSKEENYSNGISFAYNNIGNMYYTMKEYEKSKRYFLKYLEISKQENKLRNQSSGLNMLAMISIDTKKYDVGRQYLKEALAINQKLEDQRGISISLLYIAYLFSESGDYAKAIEFSNKTLEASSNLNTLSINLDSYEILYDSYEKTGQFERALGAYKKYHSLNDSLISNETKNSLLELQTKYETEKKQKKITSLEFEREIQQSVLEKRNTLIYSLIIVVLLLLIIVFLFYRQRKLNNEKKLFELEQQALRARMNPHFLFNVLNSIQRMFMKGDLEKANDYLTDFAQLIRLTLENTGESKITVRKEIESLKLYLSLEQTRLEDQLNYIINIKTDGVENLEIPVMIIQPFVENSIWHGIIPAKKEGKITINFNKKGRELICEIIDNGIGYKQSILNKEDKNHKSRGIELIQKRLSFDNAIAIDELSKNGKITGTKVTIKFEI